MATEIEIRVLAQVTEANERLKALETRVKGVKQESGGLSAAWKDAGVALAAATGAIIAVKKGLDETVGVAQAYNLRIKDMKDALGLTAGEMSRLVQVGDDFRVNIDAMQGALQIAAKKGFAPSIENLAALADRVNAIKDPTQKAAELAKIFGRNWAALVPLLEKGGAAIRNQAKAIDGGLIVTDEAIAQSERLYAAQDKLNDQWEAMKITVGNVGIPVLVQDLEVLNRVLAGQINPLDAFIQRARLIGLEWKLFLGIVDAGDLITRQQAFAIRDLEDASSGAASATDGLGSALGNLPTQKSFRYNMSVDMDEDMKELLRHMGWSAAAFLFAGGQGFNIGAAGRTAIATGAATSFLQAQRDKAAPTRRFGAGFQHGGSFIVPGSGSGDRPFVVNLEPGERVDVTPRSEVNNTVNMGGVSIGGGMDLQMFERSLARVLGGTR